MTDPITSDDFRRRLSDYAREVANTKKSIAIGTTGGRPTYLLTPVSEKQRTQTRCVRLGPDELRRNFTEIRSLIRTEDIPFGLVVDDHLIAILRRHPDYTPSAANDYRRRYHQHPEKTEGGTVEESTGRTLENRIAALETTVVEVGTRLAAIELALATRAEQRPIPVKSPRR